MLANLMNVAGVKHVITVDLHASQMQGFFKCPVDNLHAEPLIARWIRHNIPRWNEAVVVSKNAGGTKRVTSLADALKLSFGIVNTDKKRGSNMSMSGIMNRLDGFVQTPVADTAHRPRQNGSEGTLAPPEEINGASRGRHRVIADAQGSPRHANRAPARRSSIHTGSSQASQASQASTIEERDEEADGEHDGEVEYNDQRAREVTQGRLVQGHIVPDDFSSPTMSAADTSLPEDDLMTMSHASSFFHSEPPYALGGAGDGGHSSDEEEDNLQDPTIEHTITLVGDVKDRTVFIVDDMIDKPGSWIAAAETVVKKGFAKKVYCIATHGVFGADCLEQMQACDCIDAIVVTNSYPISEETACHASKLEVLDLYFLLAEAIRRNHYGESISPLFQHIWD